MYIWHIHSEIPESPGETSGKSPIRRSAPELSASNDTFDDIWMEDGLVEYDPVGISSNGMYMLGSRLSWIVYSIHAHHSFFSYTDSKKFIPTVSKKVEPDWSKSFENDQFAPLISVDDMLSIENSPVRSLGSSPLSTRSTPPRKASSKVLTTGISQDIDKCSLLLVSSFQNVIVTSLFSLLPVPSFQPLRL